MGRAKTEKIALEGYGSFLKTEKGCFVLKEKGGIEKKYPMIEMALGEVMLSEWNVVTTSALVACDRWGIDVVLSKSNGEPVAMVRGLDDDSYLETRVQQYESLKNGRGLYLAKQFLIGKIEGQNLILNKYGLEPYRDATLIVNSFRDTSILGLRKRLLQVEGKHSQHYFRQVYSLFPEKIRPLNRVTYNAYEGLNNAFNLCYTILKWKCYRAIVKAHLEPYLGYLHSHFIPTRPNLVCDFMELYRFTVDDFLLENCQGLTKNDFEFETVYYCERKAKRMYLREELRRNLIEKLQTYFTQKVKAPRIMRGESQELETLINEEALLLGKYLRNERDCWTPRIAMQKAF